MLFETLKLYPSWDIEKTAIPQRSRLYHLEPIGIGTPYVESLTGYVQRIAHEHCVTVRRLTITEIAPLMGKEAKLLDESISKVFGTGRDRTAFNGTGLMATNLVGAMSALTGRLDLRYLTLLPWAQVIYFSELSRKISKRYKEYQKARGQEKRERICQEIIDIAQLLHETGHKPTQARVTKLLSKPAVMLSWYAKKTLRDVQSSLGYE
jgi:hypothetical protein